MPVQTTEEKKLEKRVKNIALTFVKRAEKISEDECMEFDETLDLLLSHVRSESNLLERERRNAFPSPHK